MSADVGSFILNAAYRKFANRVYVNSQWNLLENTAQLFAGWFVTTQQGSKLVGTGASNPASQGHCVSVSADGNILAIGGSGDNGNAGACKDVYPIK